jgi:hypothetical protein
MLYRARVRVIYILYKNLLSGFKTLLPYTLGVMNELGFICVNEINESTITSQMLY